MRPSGICVPPAGRDRHHPRPSARGIQPWNPLQLGAHLTPACPNPCGNTSLTPAHVGSGLWLRLPLPREKSEHLCGIFGSRGGIFWEFCSLWESRRRARSKKNEIFPPRKSRIIQQQIPNYPVVFSRQNLREGKSMLEWEHGWKAPFQRVHPDFPWSLLGSVTWEWHFSLP